jgi:hypothetical protein
MLSMVPQSTGTLFKKILCNTCILLLVEYNVQIQWNHLVPIFILLKSFGNVRSGLASVIIWPLDALSLDPDQYIGVYFQNLESCKKVYECGKSWNINR